MSDMACTLKTGNYDTCHPGHCATCGWDAEERARRLELVLSGRLTKFSDGLRGLRVSGKNSKKGGGEDGTRMCGEKS